MTRLSYDMARCFKTNENWDCPLARYCLRRTDKGRSEYQAFTAFKGGADCDGFIDEAASRNANKGNTMKLALTIPALLLAACTPALPPICDREAVEWNKWGTTLVPAECAEPRPIARPTPLTPDNDRDRDRDRDPTPKDPQEPVQPYDPVRPDPRPDEPDHPVRPDPKPEKPPVHSDPKPEKPEKPKDPPKGNPGNDKPVGNAGENPGKGGHEAGGGDRGMSDNPNRGKP